MKKIVNELDLFKEALCARCDDTHMVITLSISKAVGFQDSDPIEAAEKERAFTKPLKKEIRACKSFEELRKTKAYTGEAWSDNEQHWERRAPEIIANYYFVAMVNLLTRRGYSYYSVDKFRLPDFGGSPVVNKTVVEWYNNLYNPE